MDTSELRKIRELMDRMNAICQESEQIRAQLEDLMHQRGLWPMQRRMSHPVTPSTTGSHAAASGERSPD